MQDHIKGVPDFVSKENLVSKLARLQNTIHNFFAKTEPSDYKHVDKFRRYIHINAIQINKDCMFAGEQVVEYLEPEERVLLHIMLERCKPKLTLLYEEI